jgi:hypothetical protein
MIRQTSGLPRSQLPGPLLAPLESPKTTAVSACCYTAQPGSPVLQLVTRPTAVPPGSKAESEPSREVIERHGLGTYQNYLEATVLTCAPNPKEAEAGGFPKCQG